MSGLRNDHVGRGLSDGTDDRSFLVLGPLEYTRNTQKQNSQLHSPDSDSEKYAFSRLNLKRPQ
jgi:hypothetical protein